MLQQRLVPTAVPEPASFLLAGAALGALVIRDRRGNVLMWNG